MKDLPAASGRPDRFPGLCGSCQHARRIEARGGAVYWLCQRSATDASFPRYPALPVVRCRGYEPAEDDAGRPPGG